MSYRSLLSRRGRGAASALVVGALLGVAACSEPSSVAGPAEGVAEARFALTPVSSPAPITNGAASNLCTDVYGASRSAGSRVIVWSCNGQANEQFTWLSSGEVKVYGTMCLDASGGRGR